MQFTEVKDKNTLKDTGERMIPAYHKSHMVYGEHIVRYGSILELVKGKMVLDIACGSGYGSALIGTTAHKVIGVDVDEDAIAYARKNYTMPNVEFILGSGTKIPLKDNSIDVVASYETIEHIKDYKKFMAEVQRVLKKDGLFILSTPNDIEFPESNHFHIHEFVEKELEDLVKDYFKNHEMYYQGTWLYNALLDKKHLQSEWTEGINTINTAPIKPKQSLYFFLLCSNQQIGAKIKPLAAISEHWSARNTQEYEASVRAHIEEQGAVMRHLEDKLKNMELQLEGSRKELLTVYNSRSWKLVSHIQKLRQKLKK